MSQAETTMPSLLCSFRAAGVRLIREMCQEDLHAVVKSCFALVNSSVSEGMSAAILEVGAAQMLRMGYWIILLSLLCFFEKDLLKNFELCVCTCVCVGAYASECSDWRRPEGGIQIPWCWNCKWL